MKKAPIVLVIILALLAGTYYLTWHLYGKYAKDLMVRNVQAVFEEAKLGSVEYEEVTVSGFPFNITVNFKNAKTKLNSGEILKKLFSGIDKKAGGGDLLSEDEKNIKRHIENVQWTDELYREGDLKVSTNLMSYSFTIETGGDYHYNSKINDEVINTVFKGEPSKIRINFKKSPLLIDYENKGISTEEYFKKLFANLTRIEYKSGKNSAYNTDTDELLYSTEAALFAYEIKEKGDGTGKVEFILQSKNAKVEEAFEKMYAKFTGLLLGENQKAYDMTDRGNMNADIHLIYEGGVLIEQSKLNKDASFKLSFPKFTVYDDLSIIRLDGEMQVKKDNGKLLASSIKYNSEVQYNEKWYNKFLKDVNGFREIVIEGIKDGSAVRSYPMLAFLANDLKEKSNTTMSDEEFMIDFANKLFDNVDMIIPEFHKWGKINHKIDIVYDGSDAQSVNINNFELIINPDTGSQGIKITGNASKKQPQNIINISVNVFNYGNLIDDIYAYVKNGMKFNEDILGNEPTFEIKDGIDRAVKNSLLKLSGATDKEAKDITITVKADETNPMPMVGSMPIFEAMGLLQNLSLYIAPIIPEQGRNKSGQAPKMDDKQSGSFPPIGSNQIQGYDKEPVTVPQ
ncbi:MAG: hypothetical protein COV35_06220 [Alphaproteobacteria bacterium CG11_big_fil_rev_8_21_14_0_20_39_49]|nr:MAG: hypothetical protein COV35_06220 [Alphaproteobacteria bacterium CG11_big_fil_rev_8_21_14_0_20_39_49]